MITPWWEALQLREEVTSNAGNIDDVQMSLYRAIFSNPPAPYADTAYYGAITHPTATLVELIARVAVRLGGGRNYSNARALYHLDQGMGGGKSHGLIGLYHLAQNYDAFIKTDIGQKSFARATAILNGNIPNLNNTRIVVISADHMTPFSPDNKPEIDGPAMSLWERFLWRLVDHDYALFSRFQNSWDQKTIAEVFETINRPILILIDEIMDYVRQLDDEKYQANRNSDMAFIKALFDAVNDTPSVAMVVVMISTDHDKAVYGSLAERLRGELEAYLVRNGTNTAVTEASDFSLIIQRRLFEFPPSADIVSETAALYSTLTPQWNSLFNRIPTFDSVIHPEEITRTYPFHPDLLHLVEVEWAYLSGYQRVRSTVTLFAQTIYTWRERALSNRWAPLLIGLGDLPLEDSGVRESLLGAGIIESETTIANFRQVIATDIVGEGGVGGIAAGLDVIFENESWHATNPRASQRMATALLLYSLTPRSSGRLGATEPEIKVSSFIPGDSYAVTDSETIFNALKDTETGLGTLDIISGLGGQQQRFQLTTRQTLQMLFRAQREAISEKSRDAQITEVAERLARSGSGFSKVRFIRNEVDAQGRERTNSEIFVNLDEANLTRLVILDPSRWTLLNGRDDETRQAIKMAFGVGQQPLPVTHAASMVIACVNTQRRGLARQRASEYLAWTRVANIQIVRDDPGLLFQANQMVLDLKAILEREVKRAFQHYAYLIRDPKGVLDVRFAKFEEDGKTSLSGASIWDQLVEVGRAVRPNAFNTDGLMLALEGQIPRTLAEIANLFWTNPRMPMLASLNDLRNAIFDALISQKLQLLTSDGEVAELPEQPSNLPLGSTTITAQLHNSQRQSNSTSFISDFSEDSEGDNNDEASNNSASKNTRTEPSDNPSPETSDILSDRSELWLKFQADVSVIDRRERVIALLRRLISILDDDNLESIVMTFNVVGSEDQLKQVIEIARRIEGTQNRIEKLP